MRRLLGAVALLLAAASALPAAARPTDACFDAREVNNVGGRDGSAFHVRVNGTEIWRIEMDGPCLSLPWLSSTVTTIQPRGGGGVCAGTLVTVNPNWGAGPRACRVTSMRRLTPAEAAALPKRVQP